MRIFGAILIFIVILLGYTIVGTSGNISKIQELAPKAMHERNWKLIRYEGYQWGSWAGHGGYCWYHVANVDNPDIQYRVRVSLWAGELQWYYGGPENLSRINVDVQKID